MMMMKTLLFRSVIVLVAFLISVDASVLEKDLTSEKTTFYLFTRNNRENPVMVIPYNDSTLGNFNASNDVKYITHGYQGDGKQQWINDTKDAFLDMREMNIFTVDWAPLAIFPYQRAARNTTLVGQYLGTLIQYLISQGSTYEKQHLIGWSLGGQVVGFAGASVNGQVARISSLDPAYPEFENPDPSTHTDPTDAEFVDIIHTNTYEDTGTPVPSQGISYEAAVGHVDFYPNGGHKQKGCNSRDPDSCSHGRAPEFFLESVRDPNAFVGYKCDNYSQYESGVCYGCQNGCSQLGYNAITSTARGVFYLATRDNQPFSGKQLFVILKISDDQVVTSGNIFLILNSDVGSDRAQILDDTEEIIQGLSVSVAIGVFNYLSNFISGSVELNESANSTVSIYSIEVWDPETNQRICSAPVIVTDGTSENLNFNDC